MRNPSHPLEPSPGFQSARRIPRWLALVIGSVALLGCGTSSKKDPVTNSQTHWLKQCDTSSECGDLQCECGVCTLPCGSDGACSGLSEDATCAPTAGFDSCGSTAPARVCLAECVNEEDCRGGHSCDDGVCSPLPPSSSAPPGVNCADYAPCDALSPCDGTTCIAFAECGGGLCISGEEACELSCPDTNDCRLAESYPEQLFCDGKVPANPGDDDTDTEPDGGSSTDAEPDGGSSTVPDGGSSTEPDVAPPGVNCADYAPCDALSPCDGTTCIAFAECGGGLCISGEEACELSCPDTSDCRLAESYPEQLFCDGKVPANPGDGDTDTPTDTVPDGGSSTDTEPGVVPPGVNCADFPPCDASSPCGPSNTRDLPTTCVAFAECGGGGICITHEEACELSCPDTNDCAFAESYPEQLFCDGKVPANPAEDGPIVSPSPFACGQGTCFHPAEHCQQVVGGVEGSGTSSNCQAFPAECSEDRTCDCLGFEGGVSGPGICSADPATGGITVQYFAP